MSPLNGRYLTLNSSLNNASGSNPPRSKSANFKIFLLVVPQPYVLAKNVQLLPTGSLLDDGDLLNKLHVAHALLLSRRRVVQTLQFTVLKNETDFLSIIVC